MAIILNLIAFTACIIWFHRLIGKPGNKLILPVILVYLASTIISFMLSFAFQSDYLDGLLHIIISGVSILLFWLWTTIALIVKHLKNDQFKHLLIDLAQTSSLLIVPLFIVLMLSNASFKIGG
ncbi:hypothetical protein [Fluviicola taffensis]|uniref:hypothetical protein n=1 Tax=Fluviicola taffensis TaxID=191579 RepID=UPI003137E130